MGMTPPLAVIKGCYLAEVCVIGWDRTYTYLVPQDPPPKRGDVAVVPQPRGKAGFLLGRVESVHRDYSTLLHCVEYKPISGFFPYSQSRQRLNMRSRALRLTRVFDKIKEQPFF